MQAPPSEADYNAFEEEDNTAETESIEAEIRRKIAERQGDTAVLADEPQGTPPLPEPAHAAPPPIEPLAPAASPEPK